jgi:thiol-disulfide isomerase/thioredoxin
MFKKSAPAKNPPPDPLLPRADRTPAAQPSDVRTAAATETSPVVPTSAGSGILAGQVIDSFSQPPAEAFILVSFPKQGAEKEKKPIEVQTNPQGYFTIAGLQPGRHYQLIARCRDGKRMLAGMTWAIPPNPRVLIKISEDFVGKNTPPIPPPPVWPGSKEDKATSAAANNQWSDPARAGERSTAAVGPGWKAPEIKIDGPDRGFERNDTGNNVAPPTQVHPADIDKTRIVIRQPELAKNGPLVDIGPQVPRRTAPPDGWPGQVPSCVFANNQLINFALNDLYDRPWEFQQRRRKLVLLDFWGTWCLPCRQTIPHLHILQERYRDAGLEVVGITYEGYGKLQDQKRRIDDVCQNARVNYQILVGNPNCPVKTKFGVRAFPTLVLLDANGWVVWRHEGALEPAELKDLEIRIQSRLGTR